MARRTRKQIDGNRSSTGEVDGVDAVTPKRRRQLASEGATSTGDGIAREVGGSAESNAAPDASADASASAEAPAAVRESKAGAGVRLVAGKPKEQYDREYREARRAEREKAEQAELTKKQAKDTADFLVATIEALAVATVGEDGKILPAERELINASLPQVIAQMDAATIARVKEIYPPVLLAFGVGSYSIRVGLLLWEKYKPTPRRPIEPPDNPGPGPDAIDPTPAAPSNGVYADSRADIATMIRPV